MVKCKYGKGIGNKRKEIEFGQAISNLLRDNSGVKADSFIDSELEQILCFDTSIDVEEFCNRKSAIYLVLPEEDVSATRS